MIYSFDFLLQNRIQAVKLCSLLPHLWTVSVKLPSVLVQGAFSSKDLQYDWMGLCSKPPLTKNKKKKLKILKNSAKPFTSLISDNSSRDNSRTTDLLLNATEELEHGDVGWRLGHAQHQAHGLQLLEHGAA